ncbi:C40 family peptidase [Paenibacillus turpanensis]|uniref:C40 family peptidase n=1 Tax=Paenibacillus turpanensis TaxID=2689078 RepID=UPI00140CB376|nr:C40 family peptidase [Paenibacillus turpanensis]
MNKWRSIVATGMVFVFVSLTACNTANNGAQGGQQQGGGQEQQAQGGGQEQQAQGGDQAQGGSQAMGDDGRPLAFDITGGYNSLAADEEGNTVGETNSGGLGMLSKDGQSSLRPLGESALSDAVIPFVTSGQSRYVPLADIINLLEFRAEQNGETFDIGDNGSEFIVTMNDPKVQVEGETITLKEPPVRINGVPHIPVSGVADIFGEWMVYDLDENKLIIHPSDGDVYLKDTDNLPDVPNDALNFGDDPADPFKDVDFTQPTPNQGQAGAEAGAEAGVWNADPEQYGEAYTVGGNVSPFEQEAVETALKNVDVGALLNTAKRYLGVKYKFGAAPYPQSNRFDCSSYTRYVFGKYGIDLPRTSRAQQKLGQTVSRKNLRKGDLLFFYVPGRFKSNKVAGHVGIYIGNGMMIHALDEPKDGVQYRSINRAFWKKTFITAKRFVY